LGRAAGPQGSAASEKGEAAANPIDRHGDPLPEMALARLSTVRWRQHLRSGSGFTAVAFSPDGKLLASTGDVGLSLWDVATGKPVGWPRTETGIKAAAFAPDGKTLITEGRDLNRRNPRDPFQSKRLIQHWEVGTGKLLRQVEMLRSQDTSEFA